MHLQQVTAGFENMFMSHNSWFLYAATMRIFKHYHFNVKDPSTAATSLSFSSYAGSLVVTFIFLCNLICVSINCGNLCFFGARKSSLVRFLLCCCKCNMFESEISGKS